MAKVIRITRDCYLHKAFKLIAEIPSTTEEIAAELDMKFKNASTLLDDLRDRGIAVMRDMGNMGMRVWVPAADVKVVPVSRAYWSEQQRQARTKARAAALLPLQLVLF